MFKIFPSDKERLVEKMVRDHSRDLYRFARVRLNSSEDAEDVVQQTFTRALRSIDSFRTGSNPKPWLYAILLNTIKDHLQKASHQPVLLDIDLEEELGDLLIDQKADPEAIASRQLDLEMLSAAIAALPDEFATPLIMREVNDMTYNDIANALGVPLGTVMSRLHRARRALSDLLLNFDSGAADKQNLFDSNRIGDEG